MNNLKYSCTALMGTTKTGILKPDENGYYRLCLGAFNIYNSAGLWYNYETSKHVLDASSSFHRRMTSGNLYSEEDHPQLAPGMTLEEFVARNKRIDPKNICAHIRDVEFVQGDKNPDGSHIMLIYGSVKPDRERGQYLAAALQNPDQNVCFSLRSLCDDKYINGRIERTLTELITFDWVVEPGLSVATKYKSVGLEMFQEQGKDVVIPMNVLENVVSAHNAGGVGNGYGLESGDVDDLAKIVDRYKSRKRSTSSITKPSVLKWKK